MNMFDMTKPNKAVLDKNVRLEKQADKYLAEMLSKQREEKETKEKALNEAALSSARFGYAATMERSRNRVKSLQEELKYTNTASTVAMTEMISRVVENSLLLDEEEFAKLNPTYKKDIRETVRGLLESGAFHESSNPDALTIVNYVASTLPNVQDGKYLTEDDISGMFAQKSPVEVEKAINDLSGNVSNRVAILVEKEQKKAKDVQKDFDDIAPEQAAPVEEAPAEEAPQEEAPAEEVPQGEGDVEEDPNALPEAGEEQAVPAGKSIHIAPDGSTSMSMPNGALAINNDGSIDIQLTESEFNQLFYSDSAEDLNEDLRKKLEKKYSVDAVADEAAGKKGYAGPILLGVFGSGLGGIIWGILRHERNDKLDDRSEMIKQKIQANPRAMEVVRKIANEINNPAKKPDKALLKQYKAELKTIMAENVMSENVLVRETPRSGLLESLAVNEAMTQISEGKPYNSDACIANAIMYMTITEAMGELGFMTVDEDLYSSIITNAGGSVKCNENCVRRINSPFRQKSSLSEASASGSLEIRPITIAEKDALMDKVSNLDQRDQNLLALTAKKDIIRGSIKSASKHVFVAHVGNEIVGFFRESGRLNNTSMLEEFVIFPEYRGKGYADIMMKYFIDKFPKAIAKTHADNAPMNHILEKYGFTSDNGERILNWTREVSTPIASTLQESMCTQWAPMMNRSKPDDLAERIRQKRLLQEQQKLGQKTMLND